MAKLIADNLFITDGYLDANTEVRSIEELIAKLSDTNGFMGMSVHMPEAFYSESGIAYPLDVWAVPFGEDEAKWEIKNIPSLVDEDDFEHFKTFCNDFKTQAGYYPLPVGAEVIVSGEKYVFGVGEDGAQAWENVQDSTDTALSDTIDYVMNEIKGDVSEENDTMAKIEANINSVKESLDSKQDALIAGNGIAIEDGTISCTLDTTLFKVVESLPETPEVGSEGKIYISLNDKGSEDNSYIEYVWINGKWEKFGEYKADVDLTQYQRIEDENLNTSAKTVTGAINEVNQKSAVRVDIPIRNLRQQVYTKEEILGWFNVESETELKRLIAYGGQMYLDFGISLSGNPMRYRMPIDYCAFETATRIKVNFIGLNTRDDSPVQYTIVMNLDGALNENNSNVMLRMDDILQDESLEEITSMAHTHDNKTVLDGISAEKVAAWDASEANSKSYTDEKIDKVNGSIDAMDKTLETLSEASHTHDNKDVIDGITDVDITAWNASEKNAKDYADTQIKKLSDSVAEQMNGKLNREEEALNTENKDVVEAINSIKETTDDLIMKDGLRVRIPLRTPLNKIYTQDEILGWFGVKDIPELKRYIVGGGLFYVEYGIQLSGNPYYYKMPADYCAFETANQIKLCFVGLNTRDDSPVRYTILMNLDGTVTEGSSNVSIAMDSIAYQSDIPLIDVDGIKSDVYSSATSYSDAAVSALKNKTDGKLNTINTSIENLSGKSHSHGNKEVLDGITSESVSQWTAAETNAKEYADRKVTEVSEAIEAVKGDVRTLSGTSHTHENKTIIDSIAAENISAWNASEKNSKDYTDGKVSELSESVAEQMEGKLNRVEEGLSTEQKDVVEAINELKDLTDDLIMKDGLRITLPLRSLKDKIYTQDEILKWFGVSEVSELKRYIVGGGLFYVEYGIQLSGNPYYYKMPADYCAFESANQIKLCFVGLNTRDDSPVRYTIVMNLDGKIIEGSTNVKMTMDSIAYQADIPSIDVEGIKSEIYNSGASYTDVAVGTLKGEVNDNMELKQNRTDETLNTEDKTIVGAINEIEARSDVYVLNGLVDLQEGASEESILSAIGSYESLREAITGNKVIVSKSENVDYLYYASFVTSNNIATNLTFSMGDEYRVYQIQNVPESPLVLAVTKRSLQHELKAGNGIEISDNTVTCTLDTTVFKVVDTLPEQPESEDYQKIFLVKNESGAEGNLYNEYTWRDGEWELMGEFKSDVDLTPYLKKEAAEELYQTKDDERLTTASKNVVDAINEVESNVGHIETMISEVGESVQLGKNSHDLNLNTKDDVMINSTDSVATWSPYPGDSNRRALIAKNHDSFTGTKTDGTGVNLMMLSKWDVADYGSTTVPMNLNSSVRPTVNDTEKIAYITDVEALTEPYHVNLTNLLSAENSSDIDGAIGGIDNLRASVGKNQVVEGTLNNGTVAVNLRILGNAVTLTYLVDSLLGLTVNEINIVNDNGELSRTVTTHAVLTENMVINGLGSDETTLPLAAAQGKILKQTIDEGLGLKQDKTDNSLKTSDKTIVGAINEIDAELSTKGIYNMGNFNTLEEASERACNGGIYDNINYKVLLFTVNNEGSGIIINNADHYKTRQYMYYNMHRYTRYFTRVENLAYVTEWVIDENVLFPDKGVISDELFSLGKESTSDNVKSALTMPNSEGVLTKDDLDACAEKGYFLKSYEGTSPIAVGKTATNSHYVLTYCGPDIRLGTINGSCIKTVFIDISDSGEYSVFSGASVERLITDKSKILPAHVALPAILSDKVYPKETIMEWFGCSSYDEMMDRFSGADTIYMDYGANNPFKTIKMLIHSIIFETSEPIVEFYAIGGSRITGTGAYIHHFKADMNGEVISGNSNILFESEELAPKAELDSLKSEVEALKQAVAEMRDLMNWQEGESGGEIQ